MALSIDALRKEVNDKDAKRAIAEALASHLQSKIEAIYESQALTQTTNMQEMEIQKAHDSESLANAGEMTELIELIRQQDEALTESMEREATLREKLETMQQELDEMRQGRS